MADDLRNGKRFERVDRWIYDEPDVTFCSFY